MCVEKHRSAIMQPCTRLDSQPGRLNCHARQISMRSWNCPLEHDGRKKHVEAECNSSSVMPSSAPSQACCASTGSCLSKEDNTVCWADMSIGSCLNMPSALSAEKKLLMIELACCLPASVQRSARGESWRCCRWLMTVACWRCLCK